MSRKAKPFQGITARRDAHLIPPPLEAIAKETLRKITSLVQRLHARGEPEEQPLALAKGCRRSSAPRTTLTRPVRAPLAPWRPSCCAFRRALRSVGLTPSLPATFDRRSGPPWSSKRKQVNRSPGASPLRWIGSRSRMHGRPRCRDGEISRLMAPAPPSFSKLIWRPKIRRPAFLLKLQLDSKCRTGRGRAAARHRPHHRARQLWVEDREGS